MTRAALVAAVAWSLVLVVGGVVMLRLRDGPVVFHVWQLAIIAAFVGGLCGLTFGVVRNARR